MGPFILLAVLGLPSVLPLLILCFAPAVVISVSWTLLARLIRGARDGT